MDALKKAEKAKQEAELQESVIADEHEAPVANVPEYSSTGQASSVLHLDQSKLSLAEIDTHQSESAIDINAEETPGKHSNLEDIKLQAASAGNSAEISLEPRPDLDQSTSSQIQSDAMRSPASLPQDPVSNPIGKAVDVKPTEVAENLFGAKTPKQTLPRHIKYIIAAGSGIFFLILVSGYAYYQSISDALNIDLNAVVSPVIQQQQEFAQKELNATQRLGEQKDQITGSEKISAVKSSALVEKKQIPATKTAKKSKARVAAVSKARPVQKKTISTAPRANPIMVKRQLAPDTVYLLLSQAYAAYQLGNDNEAVSIYSKVLQKEKNNRDAMLGLAAISVRNAQYERARDTYLTLLENNPKDSVAMSGFLNIQSNVDPGNSETQVKLLLDHDPGSPYLLFTLGSLYASQQRWAEAQKAFFKAYSSDSRNADVTYNLAVSLDQLEQRKVALKYYRVALELVKKQPITFKVNDVMRRINVLQEVSGG